MVGRDANPDRSHTELLAGLRQLVIRYHRLDVDPAAFRVGFRHNIPVQRRDRRVGGIRRKLSIEDVRLLEIAPYLCDLLARKRFSLLKLFLVAPEVVAQPVADFRFKRNVSREDVLTLSAEARKDCAVNNFDRSELQAVRYSPAYIRRKKELALVWGIFLYGAFSVKADFRCCAPVI